MTHSLVFGEVVNLLGHSPVQEIAASRANGDTISCLPTSSPRPPLSLQPVRSDTTIVAMCWRADAWGSDRGVIARI
jgi:hypothetical protein